MPTAFKLAKPIPSHPPFLFGGGAKRRMGKKGERKEASTAGQKHGAGGVSPPPLPLAISSPAIEGKGAEGGEGSV